MHFEQCQAAFAAALTDPGAPLPAGLTTARGEADAARFAIYRNNVMVALIKPLEARFPVVRRLVGDDFFRAMARDFVRGSKPASPLMHRYGDGFSAFMRAYEPAASLPYLGDVAELEAGWTDAYHAADEQPISVADIAILPAEKLPFARLTPHPGAMLVASPFPVGSIWAAHQTPEVQPVASATPETVLIVRPALDVHVHILPSSDASFAAALMAGQPLGEAAQQSAANPGFDFGAALVGLISLGAFSAVHIPEEN